MIRNEERVFHALVQLGGAATGHEIAKQLNWPDPHGSKRVGQIMRTLVPSGRVERLGIGVYRIRTCIRSKPKIT